MKSLLEKADRVFMKNVSRFPVVLPGARGFCTIPTVAVFRFLVRYCCACLGAFPSRLAQALAVQAKKVMHVSNYFYLEEQILLARNW